MKRIVSASLALVILVIGFLVFKILISQKKDQTKRVQPPLVQTVQATQASFKDHKPNLLAYGRIISQEPLQLTLEVSGILEEGVKPLLPGTLFQKGQVLARVDDRRAHLQFQVAQADLQATLASVLPDLKTDFSLASEKWMNFFDELQQDTLPDLPQVSDRKENLFLSRFNIYKLYFQAKQLQITWQKHTLRAPFSGALADVKIRAGTAITPGAQIGLFINTSQLEAEISVPLQQAQWIETGNTVGLKTSSNKTIYTSTVSRKSKVIDKTQQTVNIYANLPPGLADQVLDGSFIEALFTGKSLAGTLALSREAVGSSGQIWLVKAGRLREVNLVPVASDLNRVYLQNPSFQSPRSGNSVQASTQPLGVLEGDTLVLSALPDALPGALVRVQMLVENPQ